MTAGLLRCCLKKEKLYKAFKKKPNITNENKYKKYINMLGKLIRIAGKNYYALKKFESSTCNIKKTWQIIKKIINKTINLNFVDSFKLNKVTISNKQAIVNKFNEYFVDIGPALAEKIPPPSDSHDSFLKNNYKNSFALLLTNAEEILSIVSDMFAIKKYWFR